MEKLLFNKNQERLNYGYTSESSIIKEDFITGEDLSNVHQFAIDQKKRIEEYKKGTCDYFSLYGEFYLKREENKYVFFGITKNYHGKNVYALLVHGSKNGKILYTEGITVYSEDGKRILKKSPFYKYVTPKKFVDLLNERHGINLKKGGNTGNGLLYLISCYALKISDPLTNQSNAQRLAAYTNRPVCAYSEKRIFISETDDVVKFIPQISNDENKKKAVVVPLKKKKYALDPIEEKALKKYEQKINEDPEKNQHRNPYKLSKVIVHPLRKKILK